MNYFKNNLNGTELKAAYKILVKKHHPDLGGDSKTMQEINAEYLAYCEKLKNNIYDQAFSFESINRNKRKHHEEYTVKVKTKLRIDSFIMVIKLYDQAYVIDGEGTTHALDSEHDYSKPGHTGFYYAYDSESNSPSFVDFCNILYNHIDHTSLPLDHQMRDLIHPTKANRENKIIHAESSPGVDYYYDYANESIYFVLDGKLHTIKNSSYTMKIYSEMNSKKYYTYEDFIIK